MFKAKLIENEKYYTLRSKQLKLMLFFSVPMGVIVNFYQVPNWITIFMIEIYILTIVFMGVNQKKIKFNGWE